MTNDTDSDGCAEGLRAAACSKPPYVILLAVCLGLFVFGGHPNAAHAELAIVGDPVANGFFDPSIEIDPETGIAWLAYSNVYGNDPAWGPHVESHLARSDDGGVTWIYETKLNESTPGSIVLDGQVVPGYWNFEVPSLVYDASDVGKEWKLMVHQIFRRGGIDPFLEMSTVPSHSWLELHEAPSPTGPFTLVSRFGAGPLPPLQYPIDQAWNPLDASLASSLVYSEPGLIAANDKLYLSISALSQAAPTRFVGQVVLLVSDDHGATWSFEGPLLTTTDAEAMGFEDFGGSALVRQNGLFFLLVSPGTVAIPRSGTAIFQIVDLEGAELLEVGGLPLMLDQVALTPLPGSSRFGGQGTYHEDAAAGGILMNQLEIAAMPELFQIRETGITPLPEPDAGLALWSGAIGLAMLARRARASRA